MENQIQRRCSSMPQQKRNVLERFSTPVDFDADGNIIKDKCGRYCVRCTRCGTTIGSQYDFYKHYECHIRQDSGASGNYKCPHPNCGKMFTIRSSFVRHAKLKHSTALPTPPIVVNQTPVSSDVPIPRPVVVNQTPVSSDVSIPRPVVVNQTPLRPLIVRPSVVSFAPFRRENDDNVGKKYVPFSKGSPIVTIPPIVSSFCLVPIRPTPLHPRIFSCNVPLSSFPFSH